MEEFKIFMHGEVDIKLLKEQKTSNCKNICIYFDKWLQQFNFLKKQKVWSLVEIVIRNQVCGSNQTSLKRGQNKKTLNCIKNKNLVVTKIFVYKLTKNYSNSKALKKKTKSFEVIIYRF